MLKSILNQQGFDKQRVEELAKEYFEQADDSKRLFVLSEAGVGGAVQEYVDKEVKEAISALVDYQVMKTQKHLLESSIDQESVDEEIAKFRDERRKNSEQEATEFKPAMQEQKSRSSRRTSIDINDDFFEEETIAISPTKGRGRGRGRGRGSRGGRGGKGSSTANESTSSSRNTTRAVPKRTLNDTSTSRRKSPRKADMTSFFSSAASSRSDVIDLSDDEDEEEVLPVSKRRKTAKANQSGRSRRGVLFD